MIAAYFFALILAPVTTPLEADKASYAAESRLEDMQELVGVWRKADNPDSPLRIRFTSTAGGTVISEEWLRDGLPHSLTLYHQDGKALVATHYCPQGNQPRLVSVMKASPNILNFSFRDATDLDVANESYLVALTLNLSHNGELLRSETYRNGDSDEKSELRLVRVE